jgi:hypothetical protein
MLYPINPPTIEPVASPPQRTTCPVPSFFKVTAGVAHPTNPSVTAKKASNFFIFINWRIQVRGATKINPVTGG